MAKKKVTTVTTEDASGDEFELPVSAIEPDAEMQTEIDAFEELRALGGDEGVKWTVRKIPRKPGEQGGYCATYSSGELQMDAIRETFGGGKYQVRGTNSAGKYVAARTIDIVDMPKSPIALNTRESPGFGEIAQILQAIKPSGDSMATMMPMLLAMMKNQSDMFATMMARPKDETKLTDILALIKATKDDKPADTSVQLLLQGLELGQKLGGGETGMMDIAARGLDMIKPMLEAQAAQAPALPAPQRQLAGPPVTAIERAANQPRQPQLSDPPQTSDPMLQQLNWLRHQVNVLVHQAMKGGDPQLYAAVMLDNLPDFLTEEDIYQRMRSPSAVNDLAKFDPRVNQYTDWFDKFRTAVLAEFEDEDVPPGPEDSTAREEP